MITRSTDWNINELVNADNENHLEMFSVPRSEAGGLYDSLPHEEYVEELAEYLDQAQGDCTDGKPRYIILKISK